MRVGIYDEPLQGGIGGAETCVAVLASALQHEHDVEIVHHHEPLTRESLESYCGVDLSRVRLRYVPRDPDPFKARFNVWKRRREAVNWHADVSRGYDLFVAYAHRTPPFCHARAGALVVLFPLDTGQEGGEAAAAARRRSLPDVLYGLYETREWRQRMASYRWRASISEFTRTWTRRYWKTDTEIVYPPVLPIDAGGADPAEKQPLILSVGRFTTGGHTKKQREMLRAFRAVDGAAACGDWSYVTAGGLGPADADQDYFRTVEEEARASGRVQVRANLTRPELETLYRKASIFWHAAGLGMDEESVPHLMEHFGIVTVEAMSAGCVPVVIRRGGQPEIVEHGVSGFVWDTLEELQEYTKTLMGDAELRARMSLAARERANQRFSRDQLVGYFRRHLAELG